MLFVVIFGSIYVFLIPKYKKEGKNHLKIFFFLIPCGVFAASFFINRYIIVAPQPEDGIHYVWLSKLILNGKLYLETPDFYEHYYANFMFNRNGKYLSLFLPGYSFFMAPFTFLGLEHLFNPLIAALNTYLAGIHATALREKKTGVVAMLFFAFSYTHLLHGGLYFPQHFSLMLVLMASFLVIHKPNWKHSHLVAGVLLAIMLFIKPQNAFYTYFAFTVSMVFKERALKPLIFFTIPFIAIGGLLMGYNYYFTANPFVFVQDLYFNLLEVPDFCHRPGFGKGCFFNQGQNLPLEGVTFSYAVKVTFLRLNSFLFKITLHPLILFFIIPVILKEPYKYFLYYFAPLCAVLTYFTFYIEGNYCGPRYLFETGALFVIGASCGFSYVYDFFKEKEGALFKFTAGGLIGAVVAMALFLSFFLIPEVIVKFDDAKNLKQIKELIKKEKIENSIVMLPFDYDFHFHSILSVQDSPPYDKNGNLIIYSRGHSADQNIRKFYKDSRFKKIFMIVKEEEDFKATEIPFLEDDGNYHIIMEMKSIPTKGSPQVVGIVESSTFGVSNFTSAAGLLFDGRENSFFEFEHSIKSSGNYKIELAAIEFECSTGFIVEVNGVKKGEFHPTSKEMLTKMFSFSTPLKSGKNSFRITPLSNGCIVLDFIDILKATN
ncbi:MAG: hypothetical protein ACOX2F_12560 [bacterium]